jgi:hypothetical protein
LRTDHWSWSARWTIRKKEWEANQAKEEEEAILEKMVWYCTPREMKHK